MHLVMDIETTPIPEDRSQYPDKIHCIVAQDVATDQVYEFGPQSIEEGVEFLSRAKRLIGHDIVRFDLPVLKHHFPDIRIGAELFDTHAASRLAFASNMYEKSVHFQRKGYPQEQWEERIPNKLLNAHKLEAWGYRLGVRKQHTNVGLEFFYKWSQELQDRCKSDVDINVRLYRRLTQRAAEDGWAICSDRSFLNETRVARIVGCMERTGVGFDEAGAVQLFAQLSEERERLGRDLADRVRPWIRRKVGGPVKPKRSMVRRKNRPWPEHVEAGAEYTPIEHVTFNPSSPQHIARILQRDYGWKPKEFTESGQPSVGEAILATLDYDIVPDLLRYTVLDTRLGQIASGQQAWLKCSKGGRIHGICQVTGTRTSRAAHSKPNLGQVPKVKKPYGKECRALFHPTRPDWVQVGIDVQGLELRMLAHYLAPFDRGAFRRIVLEADPHTAWMEGTLIFDRDNQKTWTYAFLYGAGDLRLGNIILADWRKAYAEGKTDKAPPIGKNIDELAEELGAQSRQRLLKHFKALGKLLNTCYASARRKWFEALDGRVLACPSEHGALNDYLQSGGAILVKWAMQIWWPRLLTELGPYGERWALMLWVHDEWQFECEPALAERLAAIVCDSVEEAGCQLDLQCPISGEAKVGKNWRETH